MKSGLFAIAIFYWATVFAAEPVHTDSRIEQVTVFTSQAKIFRKAKVRIPAGQQEVVLSGLSNQLQISSLQVRMPASATLLTASFRTNFITPQKTAQNIQAVEDSLDALKLDIQLTKNSQQALQHEQELLLANKSVGGSQSGLDPQKVREMAQYYQTRLPELKNQITRLGITIEKLEERRKRFEQQLNELSKYRNQPSGEVVLQVDNSVSQELEMEFSYVINGAGWVPTYDLRVADISSPLALTYKASVFQNSGVDWEAVKLVVSTGNPSASQARPVLGPWRLYYLEEQKYSSSQRSDDEGLQNVMYDAAPGYASSSLEAKVTENQLNVEFEIDRPYTIPSDNQQHVVVMKDYDLPAEYRYHAVPKLDKNAFLLARVTNWNELNLLPGKANIFFEETYVGQNHLNPDIPTDTLLISLGRDQAIVVKKEKQQTFSEKTFLGGKIRETWVFDISIRNNKNRNIDLEVIDHIPVSQNEKITVEIEEISGAELDSESGRLRWMINLAPGGTQTYRVKFEVKYPKDGYVRGL